MSDTDAMWFEPAPIEQWETLPDIRWNRGVLEQAFRVVTFSPTSSQGFSSRIEWKPVPEAEDHPNG